MSAKAIKRLEKDLKENLGKEMLLRAFLRFTSS
jgi:hypothetical protein